MILKTVIMSTSKEVVDAFMSTLQDLTVNSKPLINVLTMIADENETYSKDIVEAIEAHLSKVRLDVKLPILYLIDCIIKNVGRSYTGNFCQNIVSTFCDVFQVVDEKTRAEMFKLRQTWTDVLPKTKLYAMDVQIRQIDPAWPITAHLPTNSIHVNPKFLNANSIKKDAKSGIPTVSPTDPATLVMQQKLLIKQKELVELQQKKIELELLQTKVKLEEEKLKSQLGSKKGPERGPDTSVKQNLLLKPEVAKQLDNGDSPRPPSGVVRNTTSGPKATYSIPKLSQQPTPPTGIVRIAPANSGLVSAATRDPRLLRLQANNNSNNNTTTSIPLNVPDNKQSNRFYPTKSMTKSSTNRSPNKSKRNHKPDKSLEPKSKRPIPPQTAVVSTKSPPPRKTDSPTPTAAPIKKISPTSKKSSNKQTTTTSSSSSEDLFRDVKGVSKKRNYVRRNKDLSPSPTTVEAASVAKVADVDMQRDVDLRSLSGALGMPPEKQPRLEPNGKEQSSKLDISIKGGDVDLRQIPGPVNKKRSSTEAGDSPAAKKSKSEVLDALFGSEDVDLRQLSASKSPVQGAQKERETTPPPPPPPIISNKSSPEKPIGPKKDDKKANLDALRAKLASVSNKEKMKTSMKTNQPEPAPAPPKVSAPLTAGELIKKITLSTDDVDNMRSGKLTKEQESALMAKILAQIENQKLLQAKQKDKEERVAASAAISPKAKKVALNVSLQPISDDELEMSSTGVEEAAKTTEVSDDSDDEVIEVPSTGPNLDPRHKPMMDRFPKGMRGMGPFRNRWTPVPPHPPSIPPQDRWSTPPPPAVNRNNTWRIPPPPMPPTSAGPTLPLQPDHLLDQGSNSPNAAGCPDVLECANPDDVRSINIDGYPRDIRFYDETAIVFMSWDDPREISFQHGTRRVIFDEVGVYQLPLNGTYEEITINGKMHRVRLGSPTRELWVDGQQYEAIFGGKGIGISMDGRIAVVKLEGPPPQVKIGTERRMDLVAGKIQLIVDAKTIVPIFLDARVQTVEIGGRPHRLQFTNALRTVLIDDEPLDVEYGGLPRAFQIDGRKRFVRFSVLPRGIRPGYVRIRDMAMGERPEEELGDSHGEQLPKLPSAEELAGVCVGGGVDETSQDSQPNFGTHFDALSNATNVSSNTSQSEYQIESGLHHSDDLRLPLSNQHKPFRSPPRLQPPTIIGGLNINDLFQKLIATGIVHSNPTIPTSMSSTSHSDIYSKKDTHRMSQRSQSKHHHNKGRNHDKEIIKAVLYPVEFGKTETLKMKQPALVHMLYSGLQCSSCGMRFAPENTKFFSQHLDWHFRQNRKGKKSIRKASSRRWYYSLDDWKNYEEIEDLEEREKNFFENQQAQTKSNKADEGEDAGEIPTVPADPDTTDAHCEICEDRFEQFYNEELEEWHLRNAVSMDGKIYHPVCYNDYQASLLAAKKQSEEDAKDETPSRFSEEIPGLDAKEEEDGSVEEIIIDDEDVQTVNDSVVEIIEDNSTSQDAGEDNSNNDVKDELKEEEDNDDDVILNEVLPEQIILDEYEFKGPFTDDGLIPGVVVKQEPVDDGFMDVGHSLKPRETLVDEPSTPDDAFEDIDKATTLGPLDSTSVHTIETEDDGTQDDVIIDESSQTNSRDEDNTPPTPATTSQDTLMASIDGNIDLHDRSGAQTTLAAGRIKINISKPLLTVVNTSAVATHTKDCANKENTPSNPSNNTSQDSAGTTTVPTTTAAACSGGGTGDVAVIISVEQPPIDPSQPLPPGEEPVILNLKPALRGVQLRKLAPVNTGSELTGLCSIM